MKLIIATVIALASFGASAETNKVPDEREKGFTDGWCSAAKSLRAVQDKNQFKGGDELISAFMFSELDKWFPNQTMENKLIALDRMCNGEPS